MIGIEPFSPSIIVILTGVFFGAFVAGFAGFGLAAASGAFLLHVLEPKLAVPLMMICSVCAQCAGLIYLRKTIALGSALPFIMGGFAGVPIAVIILMEIEGSALKTGFGAFLIAYSSWAWLSHYGVTRKMIATRRPLLTEPPIAGSVTLEAPTAGIRYEALVGLFAGVIGGLTAMPGALLSIWADIRQLSKSEQRGLVQPFILAMQLTALALMLMTPGLLTREVLPPLTLSILPLCLGTLLGLYLYGRANAKVFRLGVLTIVFASGCGLVV